MSVQRTTFASAPSYQPITFARLKRDHVDVAKHLVVDEFAEHPERMIFDEPTFTQFRERRREEIRRTLRRVVDLYDSDAQMHTAGTVPPVNSG